LLVIATSHDKTVIATQQARLIVAKAKPRPNAFGGNSSNDFCGSLRWLHIPKTSSSLCLTLQHICCKKGFQLTVESNANLSTALYSYTNYTYNRYFADNPYNTSERSIIDGEFLLRTKQVILSSGCASIKNGDRETSCRMDRIYNHHRPFNVNQTDRYRRFIVLIRDPVERLISSYLDSFHHEGMEDTEYRKIVDLRSNRTSGSHCNTSEQCLVSGYVYMMINWRRTHALGCQVKMMNGYQCFQSIAVTREMVDNAVNLVSNKYKYTHSPYEYSNNVTFYCGVFERYNESIRYLHRIAGKGTTPLPIEFVKFRESTKSDKSKAAKELLRRISREKNFSDPFDRILYTHANQILNDAIKGM
jgi:hypothetical protein